MWIEKIEVLRVNGKYFETNDIVNIDTIDGENFEQVCIDVIGNNEILIDCGEHGNWLKFDDIKDINMH
jgi:hypothetical protein